MTDIDIRTRDQIEWIVENDPEATFDVISITSRGMPTFKSYKSLRRNIDRLHHSDGTCTARLSAGKEGAYQRWWAIAKDRLGQRIPSRMWRDEPPPQAAPPPPPASPPPPQQPVRPAPKPTLLPKMPLPPHLRRREED